MELTRQILTRQPVPVVVISGLVAPERQGLVFEALRAGAFDVQAGCTGFVYGLAIATAFVSAGIYKNVLVLGAGSVSQPQRLLESDEPRAFSREVGAVIQLRHEGGAGSA